MRYDSRFLLKRFLLIFIAACLPHSVFAENLIETIKAAKKYDSAFGAAKFQYESVLPKRAQARAGILPNLSASGNFNYTQSDVSYSNDTQPKYSLDYNSGGFAVQLRQPLFDLYNFSSFAQSKYLITQAEAQMFQAESDLTLRVAQAYYDVLLAGDTLEQLRAQEKALTEQLAAAKKSYEIGAATITDWQDSKAKFESVKAQEVVAENDKENKQRVLEMSAGPEIGVPEPVKNNPLQTEPADVNAWLTKVDENQSVKAAQAAVEIADKEIIKAQAGHFPTLNALASYSDNVQGPNSQIPGSVSTRTNDKMAGVQLQIPLFSGGGTAAKVEEMKKLKNKSVKDLENVRRQISVQIRQAFTGVISGLAQIKALEAGVESSEVALKSNTLGYSAGMRANVDVLNALQQLYSAQTDLKRARYNAWIQLLKLKTLVGDMCVDNCNQISKITEQNNPYASR
ncbi:MAG: Outer membrane protein TolC [Syntrophus sp. SKADARSKE-3]|nr:Outer membrane protein TolC [Syntrophus sp. SKADARSKE-3]